MNFRKTTLAGGALLASISLSAHAALITGNVGFGGDYTPLDSEGGSEVSLSDAGYIEISGDEAVVTSGGTRDLAAFTEFDTVVNHQSFSIGSAPSGPLWSGEGFSFELTDMNVVEQNDVILGLSGKGMMSADGFEDTPYVWSFSADAAGEQEFAFSSTTAEVPEPGTLSLLGLGLITFGVARRRLRS